MAKPQSNLHFPLIIIIIFFFLCIVTVQCEDAKRGRWKLLRRNIGISAMHMVLLPNDKIVTFDRTDFGASNISLPSGICRNDTQDRALTHDCSAHSVEFDPSNRQIRPLTILTDTWCSSGALDRHGVLVQTGGYNDGERAVRYLDSSDPGGDWREDTTGLSVRRWYATNQVLPDGETIVIIGGRKQFSYEFIPKSTNRRPVFDLPFLKQTLDQEVENNLYPFVHLSTDGNLFVFANTDSILLDYGNHHVVRTFPTMPGSTARNYPSSGSSVLLPIHSSGVADVMVCGGAPPDSILMAKNNIFLPASDTCGRLRITDNSPEWEMETMPVRRVMGDMVLLPTGDVLIINGAGNGTAGWGMAREPVLNPVLYNPSTYPTFELLAEAVTPRMYHSTAHLLPDGRVLVGGSNPNVNYQFDGVPFPTELSLEAFYPPYIKQPGSGRRPEIVSVSPGFKMRYGKKVTVGFATGREMDGKDVRVTMVAPAFTTHAFSMNQRVLVLDVEEVRCLSERTCEVVGVAPAKEVIAPPGYYLLFVVHGEVPSRGLWVHVE